MSRTAHGVLWPKNFNSAKAKTLLPNCSCNMPAFTSWTPSSQLGQTEARKPPLRPSVSACDACGALTRHMQRGDRLTGLNSRLYKNRRKLHAQKKRPCASVLGCWAQGLPGQEAGLRLLGEGRPRPACLERRFLRLRHIMRRLKGVRRDMTQDTLLPHVWDLH